MKTMDVVCGMEIDEAAATFRAEEHGRIYYFCSEGCMAEFMRHPEDYVDTRPGGEQECVDS